MSDLDFDFEWADPQGARGPELRATWARLTLRVNGKVATRVLDPETKGVRDSIYLPLYPLAEWFALNWWRLLHEVLTPNRESAQRYRTRHSLASAGEGFLLPDLNFEPMGEVFRLSWSPRTFRFSPLEFLGSGSEYLDSDQVEEGLRRFIRRILLRLADEGIESTPLQDEWDHLKDLDCEEMEFCRVAASLGIDPYDVNRDVEEEILEAARALPPELRQEFFYSADVRRLHDEAAGVETALKRASNNPARLKRLQELRSTLTGFTGPNRVPWHQGYEAARRVRDELSLDGDPLSSWKSISRALGTDQDSLTSAMTSDPGLFQVDGVIAVNERESPGFVIRSTNEAGRRFTLCRQIFEYLTSADGSSGLVTKAGTERQKRNRAFAAELLLPSATLRKRLTSDLVSDDEVDEIAGEYGVSSLLVSHQIENHGLARLSVS